ncbi:DUF308 domain-containing protein [Enterococcus camelliae]|uniref:DUF308 domain-containing protein n=1 Tax=Enterococcus camelliae TaxID=453959 RepID=A0ABW5TIV8_9ENTE
MSLFIEKMQKYSWLRMIFLLVIGGLMLFKPNEIFHGVVYIIAGYTAFLGILNLFVAFRNRDLPEFSHFGIVSGVLFLLASLAIVVLAKPIVSIIPIFFGILFIIYGLIKLIQKPDRRIVNKPSLPRKLFYLLILLAGILLIFNPFKTVLLVAQIAGAVIILMGIEEGISFFRR